VTRQPKVDRIKFRTDLERYFIDRPDSPFLSFNGSLQLEEPENYGLYTDVSGIDTLVVKVGTAVMAHKGWSRTTYNVEHISRDLARLRRERELNVMLVTSGAIGLGRKERLRQGDRIYEREKNTPYQKQLDAIKGQPILFGLWRHYFSSYSQQPIGEKLVTHDDIRDEKRSHRLVAQYQEWMSAGIIPVINEDDARSLEEIDILLRGERVFRDNDGLTSLLAQLLKGAGYNPLVIFLSNTDGIYTAESFRNGEYEPIRIVKDPTGLEEQALPISSSRGRGGIISKIGAGGELSESGIELVVANGQYCNHDAAYQKRREGSKRRYDVLDSTLDGRVVGTRFPSVRIFQ